jgi:16S rRNA (uracil1498-N3)-methyltransferase
MTKHFFIQSQDIANGVAVIVDQQSVHHIKDVLRLKCGASLQLCDEKGVGYIAVISSIEEHCMRATILKSLEPHINPAVEVTIACAVPKHTKMDDIIDKLAQLGVSNVIPMMTERVIVKLDKIKQEERHNRWQKIASSASQQSGRNSVMAVEPVQMFDNVIARGHEFKHKYIPVVCDAPKQKLNALAHNQFPLAVLVLIGPEGDFTPDEIARAQSAGFIPLDLGDLVLRVDTAAVAIASYLRLAFLR